MTRTLRSSPWLPLTAEVVNSEWSHAYNASDGCRCLRVDWLDEPAKPVR